MSAVLPPLLGGIMHGEQQVFHLGRPLLLLMLGKVRQLAHHMGSTETMCAQIAIVALPTVMHRSSTKPRPDANRLQRGAAPLRVPGQMRQKTCTVDVHPMQLAPDPYPCLVRMLQAAVSHSLGELLHARLQATCSFLLPACEGSF